MPQSDISTWLQFALQQMAAESYLDGSDLITRWCWVELEQHPIK